MGLYCQSVRGGTIPGSGVSVDRWSPYSGSLQTCSGCHYCDGDHETDDMGPGREGETGLARAWQGLGSKTAACLCTASPRPVLRPEAAPLHPSLSPPSDAASPSLLSALCCPMTCSFLSSISLQGVRPTMTHVCCLPCPPGLPQAPQTHHHMGRRGGEGAQRRGPWVSGSHAVGLDERLVGMSEMTEW